VQASTQLQLQRGARLDLRVSDPARNPYGYLEVRLRSLSLSRNAFVQQLKNSPTYLDFDGVHFWTQLAPGNYKLSIRSPVGVGWLDREFTMTGQAQRIDWVIETPPQAIALAGRLEDDWGNYSPPVVNHYVQLTDASTGELIAGTRTDMDGRFKLFGEVIGEVVLHTDLLESEFSFPPHEHRFPAGKQDVVLRAGDNPRPELDFRVLDQTTKLAIPRARLVRAESEFDVLAGISTAAGVLRAAIHPHWAYLLQADGYEPARLSGDPKEWPSTHYLEAAN
jgi:hypothetical protein